jgi:hypothetical protein
MTKNAFLHRELRLCPTKARSHDENRIFGQGVVVVTTGSSPVPVTVPARYQRAVSTDEFVPDVSVYADLDLIIRKCAWPEYITA